MRLADWLGVGRGGGVDPALDLTGQVDEGFVLRRRQQPRHVARAPRSGARPPGPAAPGPAARARRADRAGCAVTKSSSASTRGRASSRRASAPRRRRRRSRRRAWRAEGAAAPRPNRHPDVRRPVTGACAAGDASRASSRGSPRPVASVRGAVLRGEVGGQIARDRLGLGRVGEPAPAGRDLPETCARTLDRHGAARDRDTRRPPARLDREQRADDGRDRAGRTHAQGLAVRVRRSRRAGARSRDRARCRPRPRTRRSPPAPPA